MSKYITKRVLTLAKSLHPEPMPNAWGVPSQEFVVVGCPRHQMCDVYLNKTLAVHFYDGEDTPFATETFDDFETEITEQALPWVSTARLRLEVAGEADLAWIWHGFLLSGNLTLMSAAPKAGKTTLMFDVLESILASRPLLNFRTRVVDILYVTEEASVTIINRIDEMASSILSLNPRLNWKTRKPGLTWEQTAGDIAQFVGTHPDSLVVIDTMGFWMQIQDENDASQVRAALQPLVDMARTEGVAVLLIHHNKKTGGKFGEGVRGSTAFAGNVDIILELVRDNRGIADEEEQRLNPKRMLYSLSRYGETPELLTLLWQRGKRYRVATDGDIDFLIAQRLVERYPGVTPLLARGVSVRDVEELTGVSKSVIGRVRLAMMTLGTVFEDDD